MTGIPTMVASIGFKALVGKALSPIATGFKAVGDWVGKQDSIVRVLVIALALCLAVDHVALLMSHRYATKLEGQVTDATNALTKLQRDTAAATAKAKAADIAHARSVEQHDETIRKEQTSELQTKLDASLAASHAFGMRRPGAPAVSVSSVGHADLPSAPSAAGSPAPADTGPVLSQADLDACAVKTVQANGWQDWWDKVSKAPK